MEESKKSDNLTLKKDTFISDNHSYSTIIEKESKPYTIMIVDDIEINLFILSELIDSINNKFTIIKCSSGKEATEKFIDTRPDILFLDIYMPSMNGFETAKVIRDFENKHELASTPIIALTADSFSDNDELNFENLFNDFMKKPIYLKNLSDSLNRYLF